MKKIVLKIKKQECEGACPIPLNMIAKVEKGIKKINYNKKTEIGEITYDEKLLDEMRIIKKLREMKYEVRK